MQDFDLNGGTTEDIINVVDQMIASEKKKNDAIKKDKKKSDFSLDLDNGLNRVKVGAGYGTGGLTSVGAKGAMSLGSIENAFNAAGGKPVNAPVVGQATGGSAQANSSVVSTATSGSGGAQAGAPAGSSSRDTTMTDDSSNVRDSTVSAVAETEEFGSSELDENLKEIKRKT